MQKCFSSQSRADNKIQEINNKKIKKNFKEGKEKQKDKRQETRDKREKRKESREATPLCQASSRASVSEFPPCEPMSLLRSPLGLLLLEPGPPPPAAAAFTAPLTAVLGKGDTWARRAG